MTDTTAAIKAIRERINKILPTYFEEAPSKDAVFPFAVFNGINIIDLAMGDQMSFYIDVWVDEKKPNASVELEELCDRLRNELQGEVIAVWGVFAAHIGFDNYISVSESEFDLSHRRLGMSARIFYNHGGKT